MWAMRRDLPMAHWATFKPSRSSMRAVKLILLILVGATIFFLAMELHWKRSKFIQVASSDSGHRIAAARTIYYGSLPIGTEIFIWPTWMPWPSIGAVRAFTGPCSGQFIWQNNRELKITCPRPEGWPLIKAQVWGVGVTYDSHSERP